MHYTERMARRCLNCVNNPEQHPFNGSGMLFQANQELHSLKLQHKHCTPTRISTKVQRAKDMIEKTIFSDRHAWHQTELNDIHVPELQDAFNLVNKVLEDDKFIIWSTFHPISDNEMVFVKSYERVKAIIEYKKQYVDGACYVPYPIGILDSFPDLHFCLWIILELMNFRHCIDFWKLG